MPNASGILPPAQLAIVVPSYCSLLAEGVGVGEGVLNPLHLLLQCYEAAECPNIHTIGTSRSPRG